jgi:transposase
VKRQATCQGNESAEPAVGPKPLAELRLLQNSISNVIIWVAGWRVEMQGQRSSQDDLFYYGSLDSLVPQDDPLRRLDAILDLSWLHRETRDLYSSTGRPSIDPVVIAKLMLIAYLHGISSERELMRQVQVNLSFRRFIHYRLSEALPDHSNLTRSRQRLGQATLRKVFEHVLRLCLDAGLVGGELESIDSTFVQANASLKSLRPRLVPAEAERAAGQLFLVLDSEGEDDDKPGRPHKPLRRNDAVVSRTDPESGLDRRNGIKSRLGYLVHFAVDRSKQIITGVLATGAHHHDVGQILPLVDQVRRQGIRIQAVVADRGYSSGRVYQGLAEREIKAFIPPLDLSAERKGYFGREHFTYEPETDRYRCPNGSWLERLSYKSELRYRARPEDCAACPLHSRCTPGKARSLKISFYEELLAAARKLQSTCRARDAAILRQVCSERTFGEAKEQHGLRRAHQRGMANMAVQALLTATVINLKRYLQAQTRAFPATGALRESVSPHLPTMQFGLALS